MAEINPPLYLDQDEAYGAAELGLPFRDIMGEGVVGTNDLLVTASTGLKSSVAAGAAWVKGDDNPDAQPTYRVRNDAAVLLQHDAADATNPRIDLVVAQVLDATFSGVSKLWRLAIIKGAPASSPAAPAVPNDAIPLSQVRINAGSGTITSVTDQRTRAKVGGGSAKASGSQYVTMTQFAALTPADGDEVYLVADATNGVIWHLRYNASSASAYKWERVGSAPIWSEVQTSEATAAVAYSALATAGPIVTIPRAGDYLVSIEFQINPVGAGWGQMSYDIGATAAVDADSAAADSRASGAVNSGKAKRVKTALAAGTVLTAKYKTPASSTPFYNRRMFVEPIRIS